MNAESETAISERLHRKRVVDFGRRRVIDTERLHLSGRQISDDWRRKIRRKRDAFRKRRSQKALKVQRMR